MASPENIDEAAVWATAHWWTSPRPLVPVLARKFRLSDQGAMTALRLAADEIQRGARR